MRKILLGLLMLGLSARGYCANLNIEDITFTPTYTGETYTPRLIPLGWK